MSPAEDGAALEQALNDGRATIVGDRGVPSGSARFLTRLGDLPPSARRLALAKACVQPWADTPAETPICYQQELERTTADALEEYGSTHELREQLDELCASDPAPISEGVLRQLIQMTPTTRYFMLIFALWGVWYDHADNPPAWLEREFAYARWTNCAEYHALKRAE